MKCGNCKDWVWNLQGETIEDLLKQFIVFGKAIGACTKDGNHFPMFSFENCGLCKKCEEEESDTKAIDYTNSLFNAMNVNFTNGCELYYGKDGAMRLAREYGYGLNGFPVKEALEAVKGSYSLLFVRLYIFGPFASTIKDNPIDAKGWSQEILSQMDFYKWGQLKRGKKLILSKNGIIQIQRVATELGENVIFDNCFKKQYQDSSEVDYVCQVAVETGVTVR